MYCAEGMRAWQGGLGPEVPGRIAQPAEKASQMRWVIARSVAMGGRWQSIVYILRCAALD